VSLNIKKRHSGPRNARIRNLEIVGARFSDAQLRI
jgi:hypothetical protein